MSDYEDDDDLPAPGISDRHLFDRHLEDLLRPVAQAARSIYEKEQHTDVISGLISTLTARALKAAERAGQAEGYNRKLQEELARQLKVQERFASAVAWYEKKTQIVVGGQISAGRYDEGPHAEGIRCERCHRQVEEAHIVDHLLKHKQEDDTEAEIKRRTNEMRYAEERRAEQARYDEEMRAEKAAKPKRKRAPRKKKEATTA